MKVEIPLSTRHLVGETMLVLVTATGALLWVLPGLDLTPPGHLLWAAWVLWRCRWLGRQVLIRLAWTRPRDARPLPDHVCPQGLIPYASR